MQYLGTIDKAKDIINKDFVEKLLGDYQPLINESSKLPYSLISGVPTSLPASDVYPWAKEENKPSYSYSEITGAISTTELQNYLTSNSYINVAGGDNRYLKLSGGTITSASPVSVTLNANNDGQTALFLQSKGTNKTYVGWDINRGTCLYDFSSDSHFGILNGTPRFNSNTIWHSGNDGSGSTLDADLLDGQHNGDLTAQYFSVGKILTSSDTINKLMSGVYCYINGNNPVGSIGSNAILLSFRNDGRTDMFQLANSANEHTLYYRSAANIGNSYENWSSWKTIAFTDSNVASATYSPNTSKLYSTDNIYSYGSANPYYGYLTYNQTYNEWDFKVSPNNPEYIHVYSSDKLRTPRTIWGQSFNGTGNVNGVISGVDGISFNSSNAIDIDYNSNFVFKYTHLQDWSIQKQDTTKIFMVRNDGSVGIGTPSTSAKLHVSGDILGNSICVNNTDGSGNGISLYKGTASINFVTTYGIWFGVTSTFGTHGNVNGDWATYFSMSNDSGRGWIFRRSDNVRVASISKDGDMLVNGGITMYSDQRKKTILNHVELSLKDIANAPLIEHYYNSDDNKTTHVGSIAQYWASMNDWFCKLDSEGFYTMEIQNAALASAISIARELVKFENETDKRIRLLEAENKELRNEIERLKSV